ncbi:MAG: AraC family transcriptional regulator [Lachnospiraceae bacterium]|nr:AraC family transcriptional regulator [Lachnospiraceae bacterium]
MIPNSETQEKRQHSTTWIPYSYYECRIPEWFMSVPMHWHSEFELIHILRGRGDFICGSRKYEAGEGEVLLIPPNMLHAAYTCGEQELIYDALVFSPAMVGAGSGDRSAHECIRPILKGYMRMNVCIRKETAGYEELHALVGRIFSCVQDNSARMDLLLKSELMRLIWLLEESGDIVFEKEDGGSEAEAIRPALEYMANRFREDITVEQLAELVHLSKSHFMRCFKKAVGIGAIEHLSQLRINAACEALSDSNDQIADIAFSCGYSNLSNFNRQFLKKAGCSPKEYRKRNVAAD